jgi:AcrR family transcriptional regulator
MEIAPVAEAAVEGRRERKKRELRARIYETARQLFLERGFDATTVVEIAEAADVAQGTFFNHFASKNDLLAEMANEASDHLHGMVDAQCARSASALARIAGFAEAVASELAQARGLARDVILELMRTGARQGEAYPYLAGVYAPFTAILREGQEKGEVRGDLDATFLAEIVVGALNGSVTNWLADPDYPLEERLHQTAAFLMEAIEPRTNPGGAPARRTPAKEKKA